MIAKYGHELPDAEWIGLPMRLGAFPGAGRVEALHTATDAVLVWSGGRSEVTIDSSISHVREATTRHRFVRHGGMVDLLPRGTTLHDIHWVGDTTSCVSVNLKPDCLSQLFPAGGGGLLPEGGPRYNVTDAHVVDLVHRLFSQATAGEPLGECYAQSLSMALAAYVSGTYGTPVAVEEGLAASRGQQRLTEQQARQVVAYVEDQLGSNLGLLELAALVGYSPDHFARLFKGTFGMSPHRYVTSRRMARAKALLRDRSQPLTQVAQACGFSAQPHFTAVFKRHTGITPGAYRRQ